MVRSRRHDPPARPRFVLTGSFHSLNRGDSAMQLVVARHLRRRYPDASIAVHTSYPDDDRSLYGEYEVVRCSRRRPLRALRAAARALFWRLGVRRTDLPAELASYRNATVVIDLSGDGLTETFGWRCPVSHTVPFVLARLLQVRFCLLGQTIGPFGLLAPWFRWILRGACLITARDEVTARYLAQWRLPCPVERTADLAFLLEPGSTDKAIERLGRMGDYRPSRPLLGVTPSNLFNVHATAGRPQSAAAEETHRALASACRTMAEENDAQVLLIPHVFGPGEDYDDRRAAETVAALMGESTTRLTLREPLDPHDLKALIGRCDAFVGMRMHSVIAAISQAVPTLALAYSPKACHLMRRIGLADWAVDLRVCTSRDFTMLMREMWRERAVITPQIEQALQKDVLPAAKQNLDLLDEYVLDIGESSN